MKTENKASTLAKQTTTVRTAATEQSQETATSFPLDKINFILMGIAGLMIIAGFLLMIGESSTPEKFNPDIFSTRRVVVGPTLAFLGFIFMGFGIIYRPRKKKATE